MDVYSVMQPQNFIFFSFCFLKIYFYIYKTFPSKDLFFLYIYLSGCIYIYFHDTTGYYYIHSSVYTQHKQHMDIFIYQYFPHTVYTDNSLSSSLFSYIYGFNVHHFWIYIQCCIKDSLCCVNVYRLMRHHHNNINNNNTAKTHRGASSPRRPLRA